MIFINIYVVTHKDFLPPCIDGYIPIQVGKHFTGISLDFLSDDTGINIADKNDTYCELTAHYWVWKNVEPSVHVGLCHYRRYFTTNGFSKDPKFFLNEHNIEKYLKKSDIILPKKVYLKTSVGEKYSLSGAGFQHDLDTLTSIILDYYPKYQRSLANVMTGHEQYFWNMFIMPWQYFDEYSSWMFDVLNKLEEAVDLSEYNNRQRRIFGYVSERLLNVWVMHNELKVHESPVVQIDLKSKEIFKSNLGIIMHKRRV